MGKSIQESDIQPCEQAATSDISNISAIDTIQPSLPTALPTQPSASPRPKPLRWLLWGTALTATATVSTLAGFMVMVMSPITPAIAPQATNQPPSIGDLWRKNFGYRVTRPVNILVLGIDRVLDAPENSDTIFSGRSDTMLLIQIDPTTNTASLLSIPRDTRARIPGFGIAKINAANAEGGPELAAKTVSGALNDITIDRYIRVSTDALREMVDLLGGVEVYVPTDMKYQDDTQKLYINLKQGQQLLNGDQAEQFARFRADAYGDIGRVQRQQQLLQALRDRLLSPAMIPKIPEAIQLFQKYIDTNLSFEEMLALANFGLDIERDDLHMVMLPGRFSAPDEYTASYWIMDREGRDQVMQQYFQVVTEDSATVTAAAPRPVNINRLRIAVQNASGEPNLGQQAVDYLREQGFRNVYLVQDWPDDQDQTQIIVQRGDLQHASELGDQLGFGRIVAASIGDLDSDLTIRVGHDWVEHLNPQTSL